MKENTFAMNFEPQECVIFVQSTKIGTHKKKSHSQYKQYKGHMIIDLQMNFDH